MKKRNSSVILALSAIFILGACNQGPESSSQSSSESTQSQTSSQSTESTQSQTSSESTQSQSTESTQSKSTQSQSTESTQSQSTQSQEGGGEGSDSQEVGYSLTKNGTAQTVTDVKEAGSEDHAVYKVTLEVGDAIQVKNNGAVLHFYEGDTDKGETFTAERDGEHTFYVNKEDKVYVTAPAAPAATYTFYKGENAIAEADLTDIKTEGSTDKCAYKVTLAVGDIIKVLEDTTALHFYDGDTDKGETFEVTVAGEHSFYVNSESKVYVTAPAAPAATYTFYKGENAIAEADLTDIKDEGSTDKCAYKVTLAVGDIISVKEDATALHFYDGDTDKGETFTVTVAGEHSFWVNKDSKVYVGQPAAPSATYSGTKNGAAIDLHDVKENDENNAVFKITLVIDDVIVLKNGDKTLDFCHWDETEKKEIVDGQSFTATKAGEHTFWVNTSDKVYVGEPADATKPLVYELRHGTGNWDESKYVIMTKSTEGVPEGVDEQYYASYAFPAGEEFGINVTQDGQWKAWYSEGNVDDESKALLTATGNNAKVTDAGTYDIYLRITGNTVVLHIEKQ